MTAEVMQILSCSGRVVRDAGGGGSGDGVNGGGDGVVKGTGEATAPLMSCRRP